MSDKSREAKVLFERTNKRNLALNELFLAFEAISTAENEDDRIEAAKTAGEKLFKYVSNHKYAEGANILDVVRTGLSAIAQVDEKIFFRTANRLRESQGYLPDHVEEKERTEYYRLLRIIEARQTYNGIENRFSYNPEQAFKDISYAFSHAKGDPVLRHAILEKRTEFIDRVAAQSLDRALDMIVEDLRRGGTDKNNDNPAKIISLFKWQEIVAQKVEKAKKQKIIVEIEANSKLYDIAHYSDKPQERSHTWYALKENFALLNKYIGRNPKYCVMKLLEIGSSFDLDVHYKEQALQIVYDNAERLRKRKSGTLYTAGIYLKIIQNTRSKNLREDSCQKIFDLHDDILSKNPELALKAMKAVISNGAETLKKQAIEKYELSLEKLAEKNLSRALEIAVNESEIETEYRYKKKNKKIKSPLHAIVKKKWKEFLGRQEEQDGVSEVFKSAVQVLRQFSEDHDSVLKKLAVKTVLKHADAVKKLDVNLSFKGVAWAELLSKGDLKEEAEFMLNSLEKDQTEQLAPKAFTEKIKQLNFNSLQ